MLCVCKKWELGESVVETVLWLSYTSGAVRHHDMCTIVGVSRGLLGPIHWRSKSATSNQHGSVLPRRQQNLGDVAHVRCWRVGRLGPDLLHAKIPSLTHSRGKQISS